MPPSATGRFALGPLPAYAVAAMTTAMNEKLDPRYDGTRPPTATKKISVPMPEKRIATLGSKPISSGASTVAPNIATTCCRPSASVGPAGRRSSGAITPDVRVVQRGKYGGRGVSMRGSGAGYPPLNTRRAGAVSVEEAADARPRAFAVE